MALRSGRGPSALTLTTAWRTALTALHTAGFGTDDALAHTLVEEDRVVFDPRGLFPLGATLARRPVAAWLDLSEARQWLADQGAHPDLVAVFDTTPPWPGWPLPPSPLFVLTGPRAECRALCQAVGITAIDTLALPLLTSSPAEPTPSRLLASAHLRRLPQALLTGQAVALLVDSRPDPRTDSTDTPLPLPARPRLVAQGTGQPPPKAPADAFEAFGIEFLSPAEPAPPLATARALEDARLLETASARAAAEAKTLLIAQVDLAARDLPPLPSDRLVDLARDGLDRATTQRAHLVRAIVTAPTDPKRALTDLTEARRLHKDDSRSTALARAFSRILSHLVGIEPGDAGDKEADAPLLSRLADLMGIPTWDEELSQAALTLALASSLDLPDLGPLLIELATGLVVERLGRDAILDANEEQTERTLTRLIATTSLPESVTQLARSWATVCAARRHAQVSVRERLTSAAEQPLRRPLGQLAAERFLYAARLTHLDGLAPLFLDAARDKHSRPDQHTTSPLIEALSGKRPLHLEANLTPWLATLALEGLRHAPENERRRAWPQLAAAISPRAGSDLALGTLLAGAPSDLLDGRGRPWQAPIDAARARELLKSSARGEPHHERQALIALSRLPGGDGAEREAIERRLLALQRLAETTLTEDYDPQGLFSLNGVLAEPPLDPQSAERRVLGLVADLVAAAANKSPYQGWRDALTRALGEPEGDLAGASCAKDGLTIVEGEGHGWLFEPHNPKNSEGPIRFRGPGHPITRTSPELVARVLTALAPLFSNEAIGHGGEAETAAPPDTWLHHTAASPYGQTTGQTGPAHPAHLAHRADPNDVGGHRHAAQRLDDALRAGDIEFFAHIVTPFKRRELLLPTLRAAIDLGLTATRGLYRALATRWRIEDYQRFMDFLRRNDALLDYRPYRRGP